MRDSPPSLSVQLVAAAVLGYRRKRRRSGCCFPNGGWEGVFRSLSACDIGKEWEGDRGRKRREKGVKGGISEECQQCSFCSSAFPPKGLSSSLQRGAVLRERICSPLPRKAAWIVKAAEESSLWLGEKIVAGVPKRVHGRACFFKGKHFCCCPPFLSLRPPFATTTAARGGNISICVNTTAD